MTTTPATSNFLALGGKATIWTVKPVTSNYYFWVFQLMLSFWISKPVLSTMKLYFYKSLMTLFHRFLRIVLKKCVQYIKRSNCIVSHKKIEPKTFSSNINTSKTLPKNCRNLSTSLKCFACIHYYWKKFLVQSLYTFHTL